MHMHIMIYVLIYFPILGMYAYICIRISYEWFSIPKKMDGITVVKPLQSTTVSLHGLNRLRSGLDSIADPTLAANKPVWARMSVLY